MNKIFNSIGQFNLPIEALLLMGFFVLIILIIYPIEKLDRPWLFRIILVSCIWWMFLNIVFPPHGFNFNIYKYNSQLILNDHQAFGRALSNVIPNNEGWKLPVYFDYTGAQSMLYVFLEYISSISLTHYLPSIGFQIWSYFTLTAVILIMFYRGISDFENVIPKIFFPIIVLTFHPVFNLYWIVYYWEDKVIFILIPILIIYLIEKRSYSIAALSTGLVISFNGLLVFFAPAFLIYLYRSDKLNFKKYLNLFLLGFLIALLPYFPESLFNWKNRISRMDHDTTFWYSIFMLFPQKVYSSQLDKIIIISTALISNLLYFLRRLSIIDMIIASVFIVIMLGPFNTISRSIPITFLIVYLTPKVSKKEWIIFSFLLYLYFLINYDTRSDKTNIIQAFLFHVPIFWAIGLYIVKRWKSQILEMVQDRATNIL